MYYRPIFSIICSIMYMNGFFFCIAKLTNLLLLWCHVMTSRICVIFFLVKTTSLSLWHHWWCHILRNMLLHHFFSFSNYMLQFLQKHITAVSLKLLWYRKWHIIHEWRFYVTSLAHLTSLHYEITFKNQNVHYTSKC